MKSVLRAGMTFLLFATLTPIAVLATSDAPPAPHVKFRDNTDGVTGLILNVYLKTSLERAWEELNKPSCGAKLFSNVKNIERANDDPRLWTYRLDSPIGEKVFNCTVRRDKTSHTIRWRRTSGDLKTFEGHWRLSPSHAYPGYVIAEYVNYVEPGGLANLLFTKRRRKANVMSMIPRLEALVQTP